jgi:hypothetical protein
MSTSFYNRPEAIRIVTILKELLGSGGEAGGVHANHSRAALIPIKDIETETGTSKGVGRKGVKDNALYRNLTEDMNISKFKKGVRKWVQEKIPVKPAG